MSNRQDFHGTLITRTDKADLYRLPGDRVLKRYFTSNAVERVKQDQYSMSHINGAFAEARHDGWSYRPVKLLWLSLDRRSICMELASGQKVLSVPSSRLNDAEYHCGIWLAHYHNAVLNGKSRGLIYTDLGVHNVLIDFDRKSVTAIDPGMRWGETGYAYEDLVQHVDSLLTVMVLKRKAPFSAIISFLKGYSEASKAKPSLRVYYKGLVRELVRQTRDYATKSRLKCAAFVVIVIGLFPLYVFVMPVALFRKVRPKDD